MALNVICLRQHAAVICLRQHAAAICLRQHAAANRQRRLRRRHAAKTFCLLGRGCFDFEQRKKSGYRFLITAYFF